MKGPGELSIEVTMEHFIVHHSGPGDMSLLRFPVPFTHLFRVVNWAQRIKKRSPHLNVTYPMPSAIGCGPGYYFGAPSLCTDETGHHPGTGCELAWGLSDDSDAMATDFESALDGETP